MLGFEIRPELAPMMYANNDFSIEYLKKLIKTTMYMNRLLKEGQKDEFFMKQVVGKEVVKAPPATEYEDFEIQVDVESLKNNTFVNDGISEEEEEGPQTPRTKMLNYLKEHCVDIASRVRPLRKAFYRMQYEDLDFDGLLHTKIDNVFMNEKASTKYHCATFGDYLTTFLSHNMNKIYALRDDDKAMLELDKLLVQSKIVKTEESSSQTPRPSEGFKELTATAI